MIKFVMFNWFIKLYLYDKRVFNLLNFPKRYEAMTKEIWYSMGIFFPYLVLCILPVIFLQPNTDGLLKFIEYFGFFIFGMISLVIINKDYFNAQSPVHRLLGFKVIDNSTQEPASKLKCMLRNITIVFWPIEVPFLLFSPQRRLGDLIASTKLIEVEPTDPELIIQEVKVFHFDKEALIVLLFSLLVVGMLAIISSMHFMEFIFSDPTN
jgi:hypothetical protein